MHEPQSMRREKHAVRFLFNIFIIIIISFKLKLVALTHSFVALSKWIKKEECLPLSVNLSKVNFIVK